MLNKSWIEFELEILNSLLYESSTWHVELWLSHITLGLYIHREYGRQELDMVHGIVTRDSASRRRPGETTDKSGSISLEFDLFIYLSTERLQYLWIKSTVDYYYCSLFIIVLTKEDRHDWV